MVYIIINIKRIELKPNNMKKMILSLVFGVISMTGVAQTPTVKQTNTDQQKVKVVETDTIVKGFYHVSDTIVKKHPWMTYEQLDSTMWFFGAGIGVQTYIGDHNRQGYKEHLGYEITPAIKAYVGRWFNPIFGMKLEYTGYKCHGFNSVNDGPKGYEKDGYPTVQGANGDGLYKTSYGYFNFHTDVMMNLTQLARDTKEVKRVDFIPYIGIGWAHAWGRNSLSKRSNSWSVNLGAYNTCKITKNLQLVLDLQAAVVKDRFERIAGRRTGECILGGTLGINYHLFK